MSSDYQYKTIDSSREEIRLLRILPGAWRDPIHCETLVASLESKPIYDALSYAWGDQKNKLDVFLDGISFPVTKNLFTALRRIRAHQEPESTVLWADAICIDQSNVKERSAQVAIMGKIYSCCRQCLSWLGEVTEEPTEIEQRCLKFAGEDSDFDDRWEQFLVNFCITPQDYIDSGLRKATKLALSSINASLYVAWSIRLLLEKKHMEELPVSYFRNCDLGDHDPIISLLKQLAFNAYFDRLWIVQEISLAPSVTILFAGSRMPLSIFATAFDQISYHLSQTCCNHYFTFTEMVPQHLQIYLSQISTLASVRYMREKHKLVKLSDLLERYSHLQTSEPLDKVYALLSLVSDWNKTNPIEPDYGRTVEFVHRQISRVYHVKSKRNRFLASWPSSRPQSSLPSWVVDWSAWNKRLSAAWNTSCNGIARVMGGIHVAQ